MIDNNENNNSTNNMNVDFNSKLDKLKNLVIKGYKVDIDDIQILKVADLDQLCQSACQIRDYFSDGQFDLCTIISGKSGNCSENCSFCAQSSFHNTNIDKYDLLDSEEIVDSAIQNFQNGINRFSIVTSGRKLNDIELDSICKSFEKISTACPINLCSSNGLLNYKQFIRLKESGVGRYHNNLETSKEYFSNICTTHGFADKVQAIKDAQKAGLSICSGGIFGLGESIDDRISMALSLRDLNVDSVPINILTPIANTPLENNKILDYEEIRRSIAIYRFILPKANIRLAGGRVLLHDKGQLAIDAGVDSMISGHMLTTSGINTEDDILMIRDMGFSIKRTNDNKIKSDHLEYIGEFLEANTKTNKFSKKKAIFISGANTDIGKTFISGQIAKILKKSTNIAYYKPVLSGAYIKDNELIAGDCECVVYEASLDAKANDLASYIFRQPYSPHLTSKINNTKINLGKIREDFTSISSQKNYTLVEGCGGIACPINEMDDNFIMQTDIIKYLELDTILVINSDLGAINEALTCHQYCKDHGIEVKAFIMNNFDKNNIKHLDNKNTIEKISGLRVFFMESK